MVNMIIERSHEKTNNLCFRPGPKQTHLYSHRSRLEAQTFVSKKTRDYTICVAKTKALISCAVTAQLICTSCMPMQVVGLLIQQLKYVGGQIGGVCCIDSQKRSKR